MSNPSVGQIVGYAAWLGWLVATMVVLVRTGWWRPVRGADDGPSIASASGDAEVEAAGPPGVLDYAVVNEAESARPVPLLAVTGFLSFVAWVATQLLCVSFVTANGTGVVAATTGPAVRPGLVWVALCSAVVGWGTGVVLLLAGRGTAAVGYGWRRFPGGALSGVIGLLLALPIVFAALQLTTALLGAFGDTDTPKHQLLQVIDADPSRWIRYAATVTAVVGAPLFEELLFRGCVQGGLRRATGSPWVGILVASALFASIHEPWTIPPIFVFSVVLGVAYERSRNLWATTVMHALFNAVAIVTSGVS